MCISDIVQLTVISSSITQTHGNQISIFSTMVLTDYWEVTSDWIWTRALPIVCTYNKLYICLQ